MASCRIFGFSNWLIALPVMIFLSGVFLLNAVTQVIQARFTVDALERYLKAYQRIENRTIRSLAELPDFTLISAGESLSLNSADLRKGGIYRGYVYDMQYLKGGKFVISASPVGKFPSRPEFAITEDGDLRTNMKDTDVIADAHDEVQTWTAIQRGQGIRTKDSQR
jgi:hypothetical protein